MSFCMRILLCSLYVGLTNGSIPSIECAPMDRRPSVRQGFYDWRSILSIKNKKKSLTHGAITFRKNETHWCQSTAECAQLCPAVPSFSWLSAHFQLNKYFIPIYCLLVHLLQQKPRQPESGEKKFFRNIAKFVCKLWIGQFTVLHW